MKILVADDQPMIVEDIIDELKNLRPAAICIGTSEPSEIFPLFAEHRFDIVFLDPPYYEELLLSAMKAVLPLMSEYGLIVCEHPPKVLLPDEIGGFNLLKTYSYGKINVSVYRKGEQ